VDPGRAAEPAVDVDDDVGTRLGEPHTQRTLRAERHDRGVGAIDARVVVDVRRVGRVVAAREGRQIPVAGRLGDGQVHHHRLGISGDAEHVAGDLDELTHRGCTGDAGRAQHRTPRVDRSPRRELLER
jgi:hypothetical protein